MSTSPLSQAFRSIRRNPAKIFKIFTPAGISEASRVVRRTFNARYKAKAAVERKSAFQREFEHAEAFSRRATYKNYDEYVEHQKSKLSDIIRQGVKFERDAKTITMFRRRFELVKLPPHASILCLAARIGSEVEAWIGLGHFAIGIDLNPGPDNPFVVVGDFHKLQFADGSLDCVYCNCLDHTFDIDGIVKEVVRVLKPGGLFVLEAVYGYEEGYTVGPHDTMHWPTAQKFAELVAKLGGFSLNTARDISTIGSAQYWQFELVASS